MIVERLQQMFASLPKDDRQGEHHPSSLCWRDGEVSCGCLRQQYYYHSGAPVTNPTPLRVRKRQELGRALHDIILPMWVRASGTNFQPLAKMAISVEGWDWPLVGQGDGWCPQEGIGVEFKTKWAAGFDALMRTGPEYEYLTQIVFYKWMYGLPRWMLVYYATDSAALVEIEVVPDIQRGVLWRWSNSSSWNVVPYDIEGKAIEYGAMLEKAVASQTPPEPWYECAPAEEILGAWERSRQRDSFTGWWLSSKGGGRFAHWRCRYCEYASLCHALQALPWDQEKGKEDEDDEERA